MSQQLPPNRRAQQHQPAPAAADRAAARDDAVGGAMRDGLQGEEIARGQAAPHRAADPERIAVDAGEDRADRLQLDIPPPMPLERQVADAGAAAGAMAYIRRLEMPMELALGGFEAPMAPVAARRGPWFRRGAFEQIQVPEARVDLAPGATVGQHAASVRQRLDPLTQQPMQDPVIAPNGITYGRQSILDYMRAHENRVPGLDREITPEELRNDQFMRDWNDNPEQELDELLLDPITYAPLTEPVVASDGRTYNRSTFDELFQQHEGRSPFTREDLDPTATRHYGVEALIAQQNNAPMQEDRTDPIIARVAQEHGPRQLRPQGRRAPFMEPF